MITKKDIPMRHITRGVVLIAASAAFLAAQTDPPGRVGRLNYMDGTVSFQPAGVSDWVDASVNRPLIPGDNIWVGDRARAELHVGSTALRLGANTAFQFLNLDDQTVQIRLSEGTLTVRLRGLAQGQVFEVDTTNLAFNLLRPGEYRIDTNPDSQTTTITIRDGEGDLTGGGQTFPVAARQEVVVSGTDQITYSLASTPGADAWDQWCSERDRREDQSQSARYVSREVAGYDDLDQYGRWNNQPGYGNVWMPTSVAAGWAPYHDGHWAWIAPWGWTWVDDAPWGFAPFHYGRWATFGDRWGWIPGPLAVTPIYAPALVAWIGGGRGGSGFSLSFSFGTAAAVGWFPLGPREPYFPSYQASRGYFTRVNNTNTVINNTTINNYYDYSRTSNNTEITNIKYVNQNVRNGVTAVPQDTFARGRRVSQDARAVPAAQLASAQVFGAPKIAPQRESVLGARADTASRAARPPANVLSRPVVARTAPPPAPVPFERQQPALAQNPGRPLPTAAVQQMRQGAPAPSAPVRVVDMGRVRRVQPPVGALPQGAPQQPQPQVARPQPAGERQNIPPARQQLPPQVARPPAVERQNVPPARQQPQPQVARPPVERAQPPAVQQQNVPPVRQQPPPQVARPPVERAQPPAVQQQNVPPARQQPPPQVARPQVERTQPPTVRQQNVPPARQQPPPQVARPQVERAQPPAVQQQNVPPARQQPPPQVARPQVERAQPPTVRQQNVPPARQQPPPQVARPQPPRSRTSECASGAATTSASGSAASAPCSRPAAKPRQRQAATETCTRGRQQQESEQMTPSHRMCPFITPGPLERKDDSSAEASVPTVLRIIETT